MFAGNVASRPFTAPILWRFRFRPVLVVTAGRDDERTRRLTTTPGVDVVVALTYVAAVDDPERFRSSRPGSVFRPQYGQVPIWREGRTGRISKIVDAGVRTALYKAANSILMRSRKSSDLRSCALGIARRAGMRKAKVALARKLAVVLRHMPRDQTDFVAHRSAPAMVV